MNFSAKTDIPTVSDTHGARRYIVACIDAPSAPEHAPRPSADLAFVLDRSGSMSGEKFTLARQAVETAIASLTSKDTFSVVVYDNEVDIIQPAVKAGYRARRRAISNLQAVSPRGTTNLSEGWLTGCGQVAEQLTDSRIGRCLLLTDGLANIGITDAPSLVVHAVELRSRGVSTSTFGVGADFDEVLLGQMADAGGGAFTFIEHAKEIPGIIQRELGETLEIVARGVAVEIAVPEQVQVSVIGPYPVERTSGGIRVILPDLVSEQELELVLDVAVPGGVAQTEVELSLTVTDKNGVFDLPPAAVSWLRVPGHAEAGDIDTHVQEVVAERLVAVAREEAAALNREGRFDEALERIEREVVRLTTAFQHTDQIRLLLHTLRRAARAVHREMDPVFRKRMYSASSYVSRGGTWDGTHRKRRTYR